jgi:hypothetical protein
MRSCFSLPFQALRFPVPNDLRTVGNWRIECSIDIDQHSSLAIAADPILLTAVAVVRQTELDVFATLGDVIDQARFVDVRTSIREGLAKHHS